MTRIAIAAAILVSVASLGAQTAADPTGHWEGTVQAPQKAIPIEIDLARDASGALIGTLGMPGEHVKGLPLAKVSAEAGTIEFAARTDQTIKGVVSADGGSFNGSFIVAEGSVPVTLSRTGPAHIEPAAVLPRVGKDLERTWAGEIEAGGQRLHLVLTIENRDDRALAKLVNVDEGNLAVLVSRLDRSGPKVTLAFDAVASTYDGTLNADGTELAGTYTQGPFAHRSRCGVAEGRSDCG